MEFRVLGPLEVVEGGQTVPLGGAKPRALLAALLLRANEVVPDERLVDELWGEDPPETVTAALQVHVSALRKALGREVVRRIGGGYRLEVRPSEVDLQQFELLVAQARSLPPAAALERLREALALWRGEPEFARAWLAERRLAALEERFEAELELGRHADAVPELQALVEEEPLRERIRAQLILALYRSGRQAEALAEFGRARATLVDELGVEPGAELQQLQRAILAHDPALAVPQAASALPAPPSPLIGRERELAEAAELVRGGARLVTLTGPGGIGKTRLALELARTLEPELADGAALVRLGTTLNPSLVPDAIAQALGVPDADAAALREHLRPRSLLLLLDNFEQLLASAPFLSELLEAAPGLRLLVTSRAVLRIAGEHEYPVPPLEEAEALFVARARAVDPSFAGDAPIVTAICDRLDRLPLAIELAAARAKLLPLRAILERLERSLDLLTGGRHDAPAHQQTLRAAIDWSYHLLDPAEQQLFVRLGVFSGGATLEAIEDVCAGDLDTLASLVDKSLLRRTGDRFGLLELLREYALELGGDRATRRRHLDWYVELAEQFEADRDQARQAEWLDRLAEEHDNLRAALAFAVEEGDAGAATRLGGALTRFWHIHGHLVEGTRAFETILALGDGAPTLARQKCENGLGIMLGERGDVDAAEPAFERALELAQALEDGERTAVAYLNLGNLALFRRDYANARRLFTAALEGHNARGEAICLENLGAVAFAEGDLEEAERQLELALAAAREISARREEASVLRMLARVRLERVGPDAAETVLAESLEPVSEVGDRHGLADALEIAAAIAAARGDGEEAAELLGTADATREAIGARRLPDVTDWYDVLRERIEQLVPGDAFAAALARGRESSPEDVFGARSGH